MTPEPTKHDEGDKQKSLDHEVRDLISALTNRLGATHKPGGSDDEEQGVRIITLAGSNLGATMRGDMDDKTAPRLPEQQQQDDDDSTPSYLVNSNFQAINNSIMLGGSYKTNDPGVHLDITDYVDHNDIHKKGRKKSKRGSSSSYKSDHHVQPSEDDDSDDAETS
ncbi:hypothetical protein ACS0TY_011355 [Phlomoides rotata]